MKTAVVLVNYGQWELTEKCIRSLAATRGAEVRITLVDNCSPGEVPSWVDTVEGLRFVRLAENTGFAGGNNAGFRLSQEDGAGLTFFLNNDAVVGPDTISHMTSYMEEHPDTGILAPAVYLASDPGTLWSAGGDLVPWKMRFEQVSLPTETPGRQEAADADFVSGCALMTRTSLFSDLGGFREDFFMYYEDAELCWRVREAGYGVRVLPSAAVLHEVASSSGGELSSTAMYFSERNRIVLSRMMLSPWNRTLFLLYKSAVLLVHTLKFLLTGRPGLVKWTWKGYLHGLAGRTGFREVRDRLLRTRSRTG